MKYQIQRSRQGSKLYRYFVLYRGLNTSEISVTMIQTEREREREREKERERKKERQTDREERERERESQWEKKDRVYVCFHLPRVTNYVTN